MTRASTESHHLHQPSATGPGGSAPPGAAEQWVANVIDQLEQTTVILDASTTDASFHRVAQPSCHADKIVASASASVAST
jgi:hypothetical protein